MTARRIIATVQAVTLCLALALTAGCKSSSERAQELIETAQKQEQAHDTAGATKSYRDAIAEFPEGLDARRALASLLMRQGYPGMAKAEYLALAERAPDDVDANLSLAELYLADYDVDRAVSRLKTPQEKAPDDPRTRAALAAVAYYRAVDDAARAQAVADAEAILVNAPDTFTAQVLVIQSRVAEQEGTAVLPEIDRALTLRPRNLDLHMTKLKILNDEKSRTAAIRQLKLMYSLFPDNADVQDWLAAWYLEKGQPDETVTFLRSLAERRKNARAEHERIADYVAAHYDRDATIAKLGAIAADYPPGPVSDIYVARRADLLFDAGQREQAMADLRAIVTREDPPADGSVPMTYLARMLHATGVMTDSIQLLDQAIQLDPKNTAASLMRADWALEANDPTTAVNILRQALVAMPNDAGILLELGLAYDAAGMPELAMDSFARAVATSDNGVEESRVFAQRLLEGGRTTLARSVIGAALKAHPDDASLRTFVTANDLGLDPP